MLPKNSFKLYEIRIFERAAENYGKIVDSSLEANFLKYGVPNYM
jgi:hypothetical protein